MPQELKKGGLLLIRRMFKDPTPILAEIVLIGFGAITARIGVPGSADEKEVIVFEKEILSVF